jgi:hypothetical protein
MDENSSPNPGFTPINTFESDVLGIRPVFQNGRYLVCFNQTTGDLITGDKQREGTIRKFNETDRIGGQKWIDKWSKK